MAIASVDSAVILPHRGIPSAHLHTAFPGDARASIHMHGQQHVGVLFPTPTDETNGAIRMAALRRAADALDDLGALVGQQWDRIEVLEFPKPRPT